MEWYDPGVVLDLDLLRPERIRPLKRAEYDKLVEAGVFEDEKIELLRGWLVAMSPQGAKHSFPVEELIDQLAVQLHGRARIRAQSPLALSEDSEPEPDFAVVPLGDYRDEQPTTALFVVEVAVSSVRKDCEIKSRIYAEAGVPEYWVLDVQRAVVVRYLEPQRGVYTRATEHGRGERLALHAFPDVAVDLAAIVP